MIRFPGGEGGREGGGCSAAEAGTAAWHRSGARRHCRVSGESFSAGPYRPRAARRLRTRSRAAYEAARVCIIPVNNLRRKCETERQGERDREREKGRERNSHVWSRRPGAQEPWREATPGRDSRVRRGRDAHAMGVHSCMPLRACRRKNRKVGAPLTRAGCLSLGQRRLRVFASEGARARASARGPGTGVRGVGRGCRRRAGRSACVSEWQEPA